MSSLPYQWFICWSVPILIISVHNLTINSSGRLTTLCVFTSVVHRDIIVSLRLSATGTERPSKQVHIVGQLICADARPPTLHVISSCTRSVHVITSTFPGLDLLLHRISGDKSAVTHQVALDIRSSRIGVEILSVHWAHLTLRLVPFAVNISLAFIDHWCVSELELPICLSFTLGKFDIVHEALIAFSRPFTILLSVQTHTTLGSRPGIVVVALD